MNVSPLETAGAQLLLLASGPMPPGAAQHVASLVNAAVKHKEGLRLRPKRQDTDSITDPVTASAFALVEQEFDELESVFARREAQLHIAKPSVDDSRGGRLNIRAEAIRDTVEDAEADGVQFVVRAGIPQAHAAIS